MAKTELNDKACGHWWRHLQIVQANILHVASKKFENKPKNRWKHYFPNKIINRLSILSKIEQNSKNLREIIIEIPPLQRKEKSENLKQLTIINLKFSNIVRIKFDLLEKPCFQGLLDKFELFNNESFSKTLNILLKIILNK